MTLIQIAQNRFNVIAASPIHDRQLLLHESNVLNDLPLEVLLVLLFFISAQFMGGLIAGSLALLAGPALMASELLGFGVSISALSSSAQSAQEDGLTFGWHRAEVIGTLLQISTVWILICWMLVEAFGSFQVRESLSK